MKRLLDILFWSVIAAAFIGPGTVTTAARAGSDFGFTLAWALVFSTVACLVLQEAAGRVTVLTGRELGEALSDRFRGSRLRASVPTLLAVGIVLGCAAYQAGNILGAVAGLQLVVDLPAGWLTVVVVGAAAVLLATGSTRWIARGLGALVAAGLVGRPGQLQHPVARVDRLRPGEPHRQRRPVREPQRRRLPYAIEQTVTAASG